MPGVLAIAGISAVVSFFSTVIKSVIEFFFTKAFKKIAFFTVFLGLILAAVNTLWSYTASSLATAITALPPEVSMLGYILPSNTEICIKLIIGMEIAGVVYTFAMRMINFKMEAVK